MLRIAEASPMASYTLDAVLLRSSIDSNFEAYIEALVFKRLTPKLLSMSVNSTNWEHIRGLRLVDYAFVVPGRVDCIIGAELYGQLLTGGLRRGSGNQPTAQETVFGWILSGKTHHASPPTQHQVVSAGHASTYESLRDALKAFWEVEEPPTTRINFPAEDACESLFLHFNCLDSQRKRFMVRLPFKTSPPELGDSKSIAAACWIRQESKLRKDLKLNELYHAFMREYLNLEHMELVRQEPAPAQSYFIPHHGILKQKGGESSIRVVFNTFQRSANGKSLNKQLHPGPNLQELLWLILIRWRFYAVAMMADIIKMFRQIEVQHPDTNYQLSVWRKKPNQPLNLPVTYSNLWHNSSPVLSYSRAARVGHTFSRSVPSGFICHMT